MTKSTVDEAKQKMEGVIEHTKEGFAGIRTGRANPGLFANVVASYYGTPTPLQQLASFAIPENRVVIITPFDKGAIDAVVKGLQESDLGVNPSREGDQIRVTLPEMTSERRQEYVKLAKTRTEEGKVSLRGVRHKAIDAVDALVKDKEASEDEGKRAKEEIEKITKDFTAKLDELFKNKEEEIVTV
jgi:ribosome recycling factor